MTMEPPSAPEPTPEPPRPPSAMSSMSGESLVMYGGALVLACYVIFWLLTRKFSQYPTALYASALAVIVAQFSPGWLDKLAPKAVLVKALGYIIALVGVFEILYDIRVGIFDDAVIIIAALVAYVGYVLAYMGARAIDV